MATIYEHVTNAIVKALEAGTVPWVRPWANDSKSASPWGLPFNASKGNAYRGANILVLWDQAKRSGYSSQGWMTYRQASELGGQVRKGEHSTWVHYWNWQEKTLKDGTKKRVPSLRAYRVFNVDQIDGLPEKVKVRTQGEELGQGAIEDRVRQLGAKVRLGGNSAYFDPSNDRIALPLPGKFKSPDHFKSTLLHELTHWTGHASRLNRDLSGRFGEDNYAAEELIAELGSAFACARFGVALEGLQHPSYLASWIKVLRSDSRAILRAASAAQRACDMILGEGYQPEGDDDTKVDTDQAQVPVDVPVVAPVDTVVPVAVAPTPIVEPVQPVVTPVKVKPVKAKREVGYRKAKVSKVPVPVSDVWTRHPVTGYAMRVPVGAKSQDVRDLVPFGHDQAMLQRVKVEWQRHGRIGAANTLVWLAHEGRKVDADVYRRDMASRRLEAGEGSVRYNYGPKAIDRSKVLAWDEGRSVRRPSSSDDQHVGA